MLVFDSIVHDKIFEINNHSNGLLFGVLSVVDCGGNVCVRVLDAGGFTPFIIVDIAGGGDETDEVDTGGADLVGALPFFLSIEKEKTQDEKTFLLQI